MKALNRLFRDGGMITQVEIDIPDLVIQIVWSDSAKHLLEGSCGGGLSAGMRNQEGTPTPPEC